MAWWRACRAALLLAAFAAGDSAAAAPAAPPAGTAAMDAMADRYVTLVLALGVHDPDYVDAYYGPPEIRAAVEREKKPLPAVGADAAALARDLDAAKAPADELGGLRLEYLRKQVSALRARVDMLGGKKMTFDQESKALYDAVAPTHPEAHFKATLDELEKALPGRGPLAGRYEAFTKAFTIPTDRLDAVFGAAIAECRRRTLPHVGLPEGESFTVEYVTGKPWSAYNWYQGNFKSVIQVNTDFPVYIDRALDLACHEGYPGHHVYNALLEKHLARDRGWKEFTVYPLFSPQSLIAEGTANYGIEVAFPGDERLRFERETLFPLARLDPARAAEYDRVRRLVAKLGFAGNEAARRYLEGRIDAAAAAAWLERYTLTPRPRAEQRVRFMDKYRAYVINYNLGQEMVRAYVEAKVRATGRGNLPPDIIPKRIDYMPEERRWGAFVQLLASPRLPGGLKP